jgi:hypothetical protein
MPELNHGIFLARLEGVNAHLVGDRPKLITHAHTHRFASMLAFHCPTRRFTPGATARASAGG